MSYVWLVYILLLLYPVQSGGSVPEPVDKIKPRGIYQNKPRGTSTILPFCVCVCVYLQVVLRIPVRVKDDTGVGSCEVNTKSACSSTQQEDESIGVWFTETVYCCLTEVPTYTAVYPLIEVSEKGQFDLEITDQCTLSSTSSQSVHRYQTYTTSQQFVFSF